MYNPALSKSVLLVGMGWFPNTPGGLDRYVYELTHHLAASQVQVELCGVGLPTDQPTAEPIVMTNLAVPETQLLERLWHVRKNFVGRCLSQPDAINLHFALYALPLLQAFPKDIPLTFTFHGPWALESQWEGHGRLSVLCKNWVEKQVYQRCDRFIVLSKAFGTILHQIYGVSWDKIHIIPGGVDTVRFQPNLSMHAAREKLGWLSDRKILFAPRRLVHRMGLDKLLTAMVQVKQAVPEMWLAIAGKGSLRQTLERQVEELGLSDYVQFLGFLPDELLPVAYQAADLTVVPSQSLEGFGLILVESLACGTPALCTPIGGMPDVVAPLCPDLVTQSPGVDAIAERLIDLLNGTIPLPPRTACRAYAQQKFDWQLIAPQVQKVLLA